MTTNELFSLLPAAHRTRDLEHGGPLQALLAVLEHQAEVVETDTARLYDNWFIETCDEWVVPYIGDLLQVRGLRELGEGVPFSRRALVANTISYRRRKGTVAVLEQLAYDASGWPARALEMLTRLGATQHVNHVRPSCLRTPDLRRSDELDLIDGPFETACRSVDVRRLGSGRGRFNLPHVALFVCRLQSYRVHRAQARAAAQPGCFYVDPLGHDTPCFQSRQTRSASGSGRVEEQDLPVPLRRRPLHDELDQRRAARADGQEISYCRFDDRADAEGAPVLELFLDGAAVNPEELIIADLSDWRKPPARVPGRRSDGTVTDVSFPVAAAVDPALGRIVLAPDRAGADVRVSYAYGFSADVGAGPYDRRAHLDASLRARTVSWQIGVSREMAPVQCEVVSDLRRAVEAWNSQPPGTVGLISVMDSSSYVENLTESHRIRIPRGSRLVIASAGWPAVQVRGGLPGELRRQPGRIEPDRRRAHLRGDITVQGTAARDDAEPGELLIDGLLIEGKIGVEPGELGRLVLSHSTVTGTPGIEVRDGVDIPRLGVVLDRSICAPLRIAGQVQTIECSDSVLFGDQRVLDARRNLAAIRRSTMMGAVRVMRLEAEQSIFCGEVTVTRRQEGFVRFSYTPAGAATPRRFRCQPDLAMAAVSAAERSAVEARLVPTFVSQALGHPGFAALSATCAAEIAGGAENGAEMGAFNLLMQPQRLANLRAALEDQLPIGLEAGVVFVT